MAEAIDIRVAALLREVLDQAPSQRAAWIVRACAGDAELRSTLMQLVDLDESSGLVLDQTLRALVADTLPLAQDTAGPDERIGPYRLLHKLGEGGMGEVWLAERVEGGFAQHVALKLIRLGMDSTTVLAQFRREREMLAQLNHPDIARLLDGGIDGRGRPWFAMEYVDGIGLREWIEQADASLHARLALFLRLCRAVAYAHQRLIVHRDLKPSNVLVRADGTPCLLDFGIARLVETDAADATVTAQHFLTRAYAAPEQLLGGTVTTATDVFALGALLFELLTGLRYSTLRREDGTVTRPSTALRRGAKVTGLPALQVRGDLDAIATRALATEPQRRYAGAVALADDVERFLAERPVTARPDSALYRFGKFVRRNRLASAAVVAAVLAMVAGTGISVWQAHRAERLADRAERGKQFLVGLLEDANPFDDRPGRKAPPDRLLDNAVARIDRDFADAPDVQIDMRQLIQQTLLRTGDPRRARALAQRNADAARAFYGPAAPQLGVALGSLGIAEEQSGDHAAARVTLNEAEHLLRDAGRDYARERISVMTGLAKLDNAAGNGADALRLHEAVLRERLALDGPESPDVAMDLMNLAADAFYDERYVEAEATALRAHVMLVKLLGADHARLIYVDNMLGLAQAYAGHVAQSLATLSQVERRARTTLKPDAPMLANVLNSVGSARYFDRDWDGAIAALTEARRIMAANAQKLRGRATLRLGLAQLAAHHGEALATLDASRSELAESGGNGGFLACAQAAHGVALARAGDVAAGLAQARKARADLLAGADANSSRLAEIDLLLADLLDRPEQADEALQLRREALDVTRRVFGADHPRTRALALAPTERR